MLSIDEAFRKFKSRLELNEREQKNASQRQNEVRDYLQTKFGIARSFLTGSYARYTKTKPLKDIDIFFVLKDSEKHYHGKAASVVLDDFHSALVEKYGSADVPPVLSSTANWSPIPPDQEIGREEALFRRTDHRLPA